MRGERLLAAVGIFLLAYERALFVDFLFAGGIAGGYALVSLASRAPAEGRIAGGVLAVVLGFLGLQAVWYGALYLPTVLALDKRVEERYLTAYTEDYPVMQYIGANTPMDAVIYVWDGQPRGYRIPRRYVYARLVPLYTGFGGGLEQWRARLGELGVTHVLYHERDFLAPGQPMGVDPGAQVGVEFARRYFGRELFRAGNYALFELKGVR